MTADPTTSVRRLAYTLMIAVAVAVALGRIFSAERVYEPHLSRDENATDDYRSLWPKKRPEPTPMFSSNDRSRWATVRALGDNGTYVVGQRKQTPLGLFAAVGPNPVTYRDEGIIFEPGYESLDKVLKPDTQEFYSSKPPLLPTLAAGEYWLLKKLFGWDLVHERWHVVGVILTTVNVLPLVLYLILLARLVERFGTTDWAKLFVFTAACFGTLMTPFLNTFNNHTVGTFFTLFALYAALEIRVVVARSPDRATEPDRRSPAIRGDLRSEEWHGQETVPQRVWHGLLTVPQRVWHGLLTVPQRIRASWRNDALYVVAGLCAGFTASNELPALAFTGLLGLLLLQRSPWRAIVLYGGAALLPLAALEVTNYLELGQWQPAYSEFGSQWYEYEGSYWRFVKGAKHGIDWAGRNGETKPVYAFHLLLGHHGFLSLTPIYFLGLIGMGRAVRQWLQQGVPLRKIEPISWAEVGSMTAMLSCILIGYYIYKSDNYGGFTNGPRWLMWLTPLWLVMIVPVVDRLGQARWGRGLALVLLGFSVFSASYSAWNPWRHPWIYDWMNANHWIAY